MIVYQSGMFGLRNLFVMHGSPVYKVIVPTACSTGFLLLLAHSRSDLKEEKLVQHPYSIGAFVGFFAFLLTFRLNFAYGRYWESATTVHHMLSKWLDVAMTLAAWHYQAHSYNDIKPPAFGLNPLATPDNMPQRPHAIQPSLEDAVENIAQSGGIGQRHGSSWYRRYQSRVGVRTRPRNELERQQRAYQRQVSKEGEYSVRNRAAVKSINTKSIADLSKVDSDNDNDRAIPVPSRFRKQYHHDDDGDDKSGTAASSDRDKRRSLLKNQKQAHHHGSLKLTRTRRAHIPSPSLFLQELAHLSSLLSAVALSTLRNDIEMAESPLCEYIPGQPWPPVSTAAACRQKSCVCVCCVCCRWLCQPSTRLRAHV